MRSHAWVYVMVPHLDDLRLSSTAFEAKAAHHFGQEFRKGASVVFPGALECRYIHATPSGQDAFAGRGGSVLSAGALRPG